MKKRPLTLTAGILGTVASAFYTVLCLLATFGVGILADAGSDLNATPGATAVLGFAMVIMIILVAICVVTLVLNAVSISGFGCTPENFTKKRGVIITAIVFNLLVFLYILYSVIISFSILNLVIGIVLVAATVLYIVDLCLEKKRVAANGSSGDENQQNPENPTTQA